tara:strand:- start:773 stop:1384 length:612 start_codon:yes stop_codon:yes gene_type:complete
VIYNKGPEIKNAEFENILNLQNVGRESHTWLYHIVKNYHNLDDINIFLQGRIDDLNCMAYENPIKYLKGIDNYGFVASRYGLLTPFHWKWNVGIEKDKRYKEKWEKTEISRSKIGFRQFSKKLFPNIPRFVATSYGGCFAVQKNYIRKYDIHFYSHLLDILSTHNNPIEGHYMERLWCYMYTENSRLARSFFDVFRTKYERYF